MAWPIKVGFLTFDVPTWTSKSLKLVPGPKTAISENGSESSCLIHLMPEIELKTRFKLQAMLELESKKQFQFLFQIETCNLTDIYD